MYGSKYQWVVISTLKQDWWEKRNFVENHNCSVKEHITASEGYMSAIQTSLRKDGKNTTIGLVSFCSLSLID